MFFFQFSFGSKQLLALGGVEFFAIYKQDVAAEEILPEIANQISDQLFFLDTDNDTEEQTLKEINSPTTNSKNIITHYKLFSKKKKIIKYGWKDFHLL